MLTLSFDSHSIDGNVEFRGEKKSISNMYSINHFWFLLHDLHCKTKMEKFYRKPNGLYRLSSKSSEKILNGNLEKLLTVKRHSFVIWFKGIVILIFVKNLSLPILRSIFKTVLKIRVWKITNVLNNVYWKLVTEKSYTSLKASYLFTTSRPT